MAATLLCVVLYSSLFLGTVLAQDEGCDNPPHIENGYFKSPFDTQLGSQVYYACNAGYKLVGPEFVQCQNGDSSLVWSQAPTCIAIGFEMVAGNTIECLPGPVWSKPSPECRVVCGPVPVIANGYTNSMASSSIGTTIEYECNEGYELVDDNSTVCVYNNKTSTVSWRQPLPACTEITCEPPQLIINTEFVLNDTTMVNETTFFINDTMLYQCIDGYFFIDQAPGHNMTQTFDTDDEQSMVPSDSAEDENVTATVNYTTTTAPPPYFGLDNETFSENETTSGYFEQTSPGITVTDEPPTASPLPVTTEVSGPIQSITCQLVDNKPVWTKMKSCLIDCWPIPNVDNANNSIPPNTLLGSVVEYTCKPGYKLVGPTSIMCLGDRLWSDLPYCQLVCPEVDIVPHATSVHTYSAGVETVTFTCDEGYQPVNGSTITCYSGIWSSPYPVCECIVKPSDIVFIVDGSGSIAGGEFAKELDFVNAMVSRYPYAKTRFGMIVFSSNINVQFYLNEFTNNQTALIDKITNAPFPGGTTNTADALMIARTDLFTEAHGMRPNVSHIAIVITDGESVDTNATIVQAELLRNEEVTIYSVGVGLADKTELNNIASNESLVYQVENFNALTDIEGPLAEITCEGQADEEFWTENDDEDLLV